MRRVPVVWWVLFGLGLVVAVAALLAILLGWMVSPWAVVVYTVAMGVYGWVVSLAFHRKVVRRLRAEQGTRRGRS